MKILFFVLFLLFPTIAWSAPSTTVSITPSATDATTITASDENTRNSAISTWANAHDHNDIDQTGNTLAVGDATAGNKTITANNADSNKPFIRYDDTNDRWVLSRDGSTIETIIVLTGATGSYFSLPSSMTNNQIIEYNSTTTRLEADSPNYMADDDQDTLIQLEESANENIIRMDTNGTERWNMSAEGERKMTTQPAFLAIKALDQDNLTADLLIDMIFATEVFDQSGDYVAATSIFTAPVDGRYMLSSRIVFINMDTVATNYEMRIVTSNRTYTMSMDPRQFAADVAGKWGVMNTVLADMDASDTAKVQFLQTAGTAQTDVQGTTENIFSGFLAL